MSEFAVSVREITHILPHSNADKLEVMRLSGMLYNIVTEKDAHTVGEKMVYFPVDSIIPDDLVKELDIKYLSKKKVGQVVQAAKLRGVVSEGLALPLSAFFYTGFVQDLDVGYDLTAELGVTKYELPEAPEHKQGNKPARKRKGISLPSFVKYYDIENLQSHLETWKLLNKSGYKVFTEKIEGQHHVTARRGQQVFVTSRQVNRDEESYYWQIAKDLGLLDKIMLIGEPDDTVVIRSELIGPGIQNNIYGVDHMELFTFDIEINGQILDYFDLVNICNKHRIARVPMLRIVETMLLPEEVLEFAHRRSVLNQNVTAEGVVVKPLKEKLDDYGERLQLKIRDGFYLAAWAKGNVEWTE